VPEGLVLIYAPRNEEEVDVVRKVVRAAAWWVTGVDLDQVQVHEGEEELRKQLLDKRNLAAVLLSHHPSYLTF
jgi:hypothetical protein